MNDTKSYWELRAVKAEQRVEEQGKELEEARLDLAEADGIRRTYVGIKYELEAKVTALRKALEHLRQCAHGIMPSHTDHRYGLPDTILALRNPAWTRLLAVLLGAETALAATSPPASETEETLREGVKVGQEARRQGNVQSLEDVKKELASTTVCPCQSKRLRPCEACHQADEWQCYTGLCLRCVDGRIEKATP